MTDLITTARELCEGSVDPRIVRTVYELCEALESANKEVERLKNEPPAYRFYYCDTEDSYLLGQRLDNFYYAHWYKDTGFVFDMSRYLPWGEHVVRPDTAWKEHTYPSEPREIDTTEWFRGFIKKYFLAPPANGGGK